MAQGKLCVSSRKHLISSSGFVKIYPMTDYAQMVLDALAAREPVRSVDLEVPSEALHGVLLSLQSHEKVEFSIEEHKGRALTEEGSTAAQKGSPEYLLYTSIPEEGEDASVLDAHPHARMHAFKNRWLSVKDGRVFRTSSAEDTVAMRLRDLALIEDAEFTALRRRGLVRETRENTYVIRKGPRFGETDDVPSILTAAMLTGYRGERFKRYNFDAAGTTPACGSLHPLMKMRTEFKRIFVEMGFSEMDTARYVESSFWNFDALFQPQNHPSRDAHDTFFLSVPAQSNYAEVGGKKDSFGDYFERVRDIHTHGGFGSTGHGTRWCPLEAAKNILRTHTTSISARMLWNLAENFTPVRLFSIDKVFRNESVDATHLAEFHQVEGLIAGPGLGIGELIGLLSAFFERLGLKDIRFKPAFNPYTEPSMEVFGFHPGFGRWIEIGNSGVFRPEMLRPMGFPPEVSVIAWGLSLERPAMIKYGLNNIRDLVGHRCDIDFARRSEFVFFE